MKSVQYCYLKYDEKPVRIIPHNFSNYYFDLQEEKIYKDLDKKLRMLSNENWNFMITQTRSRYKVFDYIIAEPKITNFNDYKKIFYGSSSIVSKYEKIKLWKMNEEELKKCSRDINYLKQILLPIMIKNRNILLKYKNEEIRFLISN